MTKLLLVARDREPLSALASALAQDEDVSLSWAESGGQALALAAEEPPHLVVTAEELGDMTGLELVRRLLAVSVTINFAALSSLSARDFHEASEGLGIMAQLPLRPGPEQAQKLLQRLKKMQVFPQ
ncbi:MAG: response regulator [Deltaproteobacteria bacterium]|nr:response regulator [Deltaproteobacteria bacterium]